MEFETIREVAGSFLGSRHVRHALQERAYIGETSDYLIAIRLGGSGEVTRYDGNKIDGNRANLGSVCISGAEHEHGWLFPKMTEVLHFYANRCQLEEIVQKELDIDGKNLQLEPVWNARDPFLHQMAMTADQALNRSAPLDLLLLDQLDTVLKSYLLQNYSNVGKALASHETVSFSEDKRIQRTIEFIEDNLSKALRLNDLVHVAAMSPSALMRAFKKSTGCSIATFVRQRRLERAAIMLTRTTKNLAQVALATGFSDHAHFTRTFKAHFGVTPSDWRL